jgi:hypothetical protein
LFRPGRLSRSRLEGLPPTSFEWSGARSITTQDFRAQEGLCTRERQAELVARGAKIVYSTRRA